MKTAVNLLLGEIEKEKDMPPTTEKEQILKDEFDVLVLEDYVVMTSRLDELEAKLLSYHEGGADAHERQAIHLEKNVKRLANELSVEKGKVAYLEGGVERVTAQKDEMASRKAELQGCLDRSNKCLEETREAKSKVMLERDGLKDALATLHDLTFADAVLPSWSVVVSEITSPIFEVKEKNKS